MNAITAPLGGLIGAILGGVLWAKYIQWTGNTAGFIAIAIGLLCGIGIVLTGSRALESNNQKHWIYLAIGAALFSIFGVCVGKYLDVQLNAVTQIAEQIVEEEPAMTIEQATPIAEGIYSGSTKWELIQQRSEWFDLIYIAIAVIVSIYFTLNRSIRKILSSFTNKRNM